MREMKDSGIEWIGEIPKEWKIDKIKYHLKRNEPKKHGNAIVLSVYRDYGVIPKDSRDDNHNVTSEDTSKYKYVKKGQLVINKMKAWQGSLAVSDYNGIVSPAYFIYDFTDEEYNHKYFHYLVRSCYKEEFKRISGGIREGQWDLSPEAFANTLALLPPLVEQKYIANYLDIQCSEIDATAEDIQKEISLLEEYKKSVITEAVTKGLNPDAEMKDSGIKWIGKIPINWQAVNPRWLFAQRKDRAKKGMEQYTASQKYGVISQKDYMNRIGGSIVTVQKDFDILKMVCEGDFVIHMRSFQGGLEYSKHTGSISSAYVMLIPQKNTGECRYFKWLFKSASYINALQSTSNLIRDGQAMRYSNFIQIIIPYPPLDEQQQIADYLDSKCSEIDAIIADKKRQLDILADYKKSLIYEYVTGKKEVPVHE